MATKRALRGRVVTRVAVTMTLHLLAMHGRPLRNGLQCMSICWDCRPGAMGAITAAADQDCRYR